MRITIAVHHQSLSQLIHVAAFCTTMLCLTVAHAETLTGRTVGVSDGDTITVLDLSNTQHKIRLAGIDATEKSQPFGQRSKESLSELVFGRTVTLETAKVDRYRRKVGKVRTPEGMDANLEQVRRGLAWHYKEYEQEQTEADRATYAAAENVARAQRRGLWGDTQQVAPWEFRRAQREQRDGSNIEFKRVER